MGMRLKSTKSKYSESFSIIDDYAKELEVPATYALLTEDLLTKVHIPTVELGLSLYEGQLQGHLDSSLPRFLSAVIVQEDRFVAHRIVRNVLYHILTAKAKPEALWENLVVSLIYGKFYPQLKLLLPILDPNLLDRWQVEAREHPFQSKWGKVIRSNNGRFICSIYGELPPPERGEYHGGTTYVVLHDARDNRSVTFKRNITALHWRKNDELWIVLGESEPLIVDLEGWRFMQDPRLNGHSHEHWHSLCLLPERSSR